jgi:hypothetical protein
MELAEVPVRPDVAKPLRWGSSASPPCVPFRKAGIDHHDVVAIILLNVREVFRERVGI